LREKIGEYLTCPHGDLNIIPLTRAPVLLQVTYWECFSHSLKAFGLMIASFLDLQNGTDKHRSTVSKAVLCGRIKKTTQVGDQFDGECSMER
jgi:hypothetical protein